jgi:hypothetical protein
MVGFRGGGTLSARSPRRSDLFTCRRSLFPLPQGVDILWFKLLDSQRLESENIFYSIVKDTHAFGLFRSSEGNI